MIYYDQIRVDQLRNFLVVCFKRLPNENAFYKILIENVRDYGNVVIQFLRNKVQLLVAKCITKLENGKVKNKFLFQSFSRKMKRYLKTIELLFGSFKHIEKLNFEIDELMKIYLQEYLKKNKFPASY